jgi:methionyl-tRNA formyltransferase
MRIGVIGCVNSSKMALETLLSIEYVHVCAVITRQNSKTNSDFFDLSPICVQNNIPFHLEDPSKRNESVSFLEKFNLDVIYCVGWSYLLSEKMLSIPKMGVVGFHPAKLPLNRGRHPIIWALALGLEETASTFFKMDKYADSGAIISQEIIPIYHSDYAKNLYNRILDVAKIQIQKFTYQLSIGTCQFVQQNQLNATYWRKRSHKDGIIDFRMTACSIYNLVRALAPPYPCAEFLFNGNYISVARSSIENDIFPNYIEPGFVIKKCGSNILVKTSGNGAIWLEGIVESSISVGDYL